MKALKRILLLLCLLYFASLPVWSQEQATPMQDDLTQSWTTFDELIVNLRSEIDSLSLQIASISSDLTQSQAELQALKMRLAERETAYQRLEQSLMQSTISLKTCESRLQSANLKLAISILANVVLTGGIIYMILH